MENVYNENDELINLAEESDLDKKGNFKVLKFESLAELEKALVDYKGYTLFGYNNKIITINGVNMQAWTQFFIPFITETDDILFAIQPNVNNFSSILGHVGGEWIIKML